MLPITIVVCDRYGDSDVITFHTLTEAKDGLERLLDSMEDQPSLALHHAIESLKDAIGEAE
jgi:hypothetical protein